MNRKIHKLITRETWGKGHFAALGTNGRLCATAWINKIYPSPGSLVPYNRMCAAVGIEGPGPGGALSNWNDLTETTFEDVLTAFREADI